MRIDPNGVVLRQPLARRAARVVLLVALPALLSLPGEGRAGVLTVKEVVQEQSQWCWAAVGQVLLDYYGHTFSQCAIAEYTRKNASWHDFGDADCCVDPTKGCNYWNYLSSSSGGVSDIVKAFGNLPSKSAGAMTTSQVAQEIDVQGRPFVARWGWKSGGGHFVVVHGQAGEMISYMNPWKGEGIKTAKYSWFKKGSNHTWTMSLKLTTTCKCTAESACCDGCQVKNEGNPCSDGDLCTTGDTCQAGRCVTGATVDCGPSTCAKKGVCDSLTGTCNYTTPPNGSKCDDGDLCTTGDMCSAGVCAGKAVACKAASDCQLAGVCNPATGSCEHTPRPDGTACDDSDACTVSDSCMSGACTGKAKGCPDPGQCRLRGVCNRTTGSCDYPVAPDDTGCDDNNPCTLVDRCLGGLCTGSMRMPCPPRPCHTVGGCEAATGACVYAPLPDGAACSGGVCRAGACVSGADPDGGIDDLGTDDSATSQEGGGAQGGCAVAGPGEGVPAALALLLLVALRRRSSRGFPCRS